MDKLNQVDEFTRLRAPDASAQNAAALAALTPLNLIDRRLYATKLSALSQLEAHLQEVKDSAIAEYQTLHLSFSLDVD